MNTGCTDHYCSGGACRSRTAVAGTVCQPATTGYNAAVCDGASSTCPAPTCVSGYKSCSATNTCIAQAACCLGDCPFPFADDFASGTATNWTTVWGTGRSGAPNQLMLTGSTRVDAGMPTWSTYVVQASVVFPDATSTARIYGFTQGSNGYYRFEVGADGHWAIQRADSTGLLTTLQQGSVSITPGFTSYYMRMVLESAVVAAEMSDDNGQTFLPLGSVSDATFSSGRIGLEGNAGPGAAVIFGHVSAAVASVGSIPVGSSSSLTACTGSSCAAPPGPINDGCHGDCACFAGGLFGIDGTQCDSFFRAPDGSTAPIPDSYRKHFPLVRDHEDIIGTVNAGGCDAQNKGCADGTCAQPSIAGTDDAGVHDDRDFEFHVTPDNRNALTDANLFGNSTNGMADIGVEWEWMYMFPLWNSRFASERGWRLSPTGFPRMTGDQITVGVPFRGDRIKLRGRLILDCGHVGGNNEARSEIHPPTAIAWMHKSENETRTGMVWMRFSSEATNPGLGDSFGPPFTATFSIPDSPNDQPLYVGPVISDWVVDEGNSTAPLAICTNETDHGPIGLNFGHPWAHIDIAGQCPTEWPSPWGDSYPTPEFAAYKAMAGRDISSYFNVTTSGDPASNTVTITATPVRTHAGTSFSIPYIGGAHLQACYPQCDANRLRTNSCHGPLVGACAQPIGVLELAANAAGGGTVFTGGGGQMNVKGWAVDPVLGTANYVRIDITVDGSVVGSLTGANIHQDRTDLVLQHGNDPNYLKSGYSGTVPFNGGPGPHVITARLVDPKGISFAVGSSGATTSCGPSNCPTGCCDSSSACHDGREVVACGGGGGSCSNCTTIGGQFTCTNRECVGVTPPGTVPTCFTKCP